MVSDVGRETSTGHAAPLHSCKYRRLHAPATKLIKKPASNSRVFFCTSDSCERPQPSVICTRSAAFATFSLKQSVGDRTALGSVNDRWPGGNGKKQLMPMIITIQRQSGATPDSCSLTRATARMKTWPRSPTRPSTGASRRAKLLWASCTFSLYGGFIWLERAVLPRYKGLA